MLEVWKSQDFYHVVNRQVSVSCIVEVKNFRIEKFVIVFDILKLSFANFGSSKINPCKILGPIYLKHKQMVVSLCQTMTHWIEVTFQRLVILCLQSQVCNEHKTDSISKIL